MKIVDLREHALEPLQGHTSKGDQPKWQLRGQWYKADHMGYEALAEVIVSRLLLKSNVIIIEAMKQLLAEQRFDKITVQNIIDRAHCSRGTFYRHFKVKYDIMNYYYLESNRDILSNSELSGREKTEAIVDSVLKNKEYFGGVVDVEGINSFRNFVKQCSKQFYLAVYCEKFRADASIPAEIDFMTDFLAEGCAATIDKWLIGDGGLSKEQLVDSLFRMTPEELR